MIVSPKRLQEQFKYAVEIENEKLEGWGRKYNGSIISYKDDTLFAYRRFNPEHKRCDIGLSRLNPVEDYQPIDSWGLQLPYKTNKEHYEDPRLFHHKGRLWLAVSMITDYKRQPWISIQKVFRITEDLQGVDRELFIKVGANGTGQEKNWQFFSEKGKLYCVYYPKTQVVLEVDDETGKLLNHWKSEGIVDWKYGTMSGGTPPVKVGNEYVSFFHGFKACLPDPYHRRYFFGAYTFETSPPFAVKRITPIPLGIATDKDPFYGHPGFFGWQPQVHFPCGSIYENGTWTISLGVNDCFNAVVKIDDLDNMLVNIGDNPKNGITYFVSRNVGRSRVPAYLTSPEQTPIRMGRYGMFDLIKAVDDCSVKYMEGRRGYCRMSEEEGKKIEKGGLNKKMTALVLQRMGIEDARGLPI